MTTIEVLIAEAVVRRSREALERRAEARVVRIFRSQARSFPALSVARFAADKFTAWMVEAPADDELLGIIDAVWPDGTGRIAAAIEAARAGATLTAGDLALAEIGYEEAFRVGELIARRIRETALLRAQGIDAFSRQRMRDVLAEGIVRGDNPRAIARTLRSEILMWTSRPAGATAYRAETIARTEVAEAWGSTLQSVWEHNGWAARRWVTAHDDRVDQGGSGPCIDNEAAGDVPIGDAFPSGDMHPPSHPRCRCATVASTGFGPGEQRGERRGEPWAGE